MADNALCMEIIGKLKLKVAKFIQIVDLKRENIQLKEYKAMILKQSLTISVLQSCVVNIKQHYLTKSQEYVRNIHSLIEFYEGQYTEDTV